MTSEDHAHRLIAGRYRLHSALGFGSMGTVWTGYDELLRRPVAVKEIRLPPGVPATQVAELRERTLREARAIAVLSHPNVITLHDIAQEHGEPFIVMELLPSRSLATLLRERGPLAPPQAAAIADALAAALLAAHQAGITHRDIKPGNVLVSDDGRIKLTDFGISRNVAEVTMTHTGIMLGSPAYIAPEVAAGRAVTPAADLWGLGATLYAMVEGRPPYDADGDPLETLNLVVHGRLPKPSPSPLAAVITGLMRKEPHKRTSLAELRRQLRPLLDPHGDQLFGFGPGTSPTDDTKQIPQDGEKFEATRPTKAGNDPAATLAAPASQEPTGKRKTGTHLPLILAAVLLFLVATAGAFVATRLIGAGHVFPDHTDQPPASSSLPTQLTARTEETAGRGNPANGRFTVDVPVDWPKFVSRREADELPESTVVQFVAPDGVYLLNVERFTDFYPRRNVQDYLEAIENRWPAEDFARLNVTPLAGEYPGVSTTYRTIEQKTMPGNNSSNSDKPSDPERAWSVGRTTFARAIRVDDDLWVISVTVPTEQEDAGRTGLFDRVAPSFRVA